MQGTNLCTEPKHIVFLSQLLLLFKFCHVCKADNPMIEAGGIGTEAVIKTTCSNPACSKEKTWYSQPLIPGTQMPAGNFLLCLSILLVGGSAMKVFQMFSHMGLGHISLNTFFKCQRVSEDILIILKDICHNTLNGSFNTQKCILTICVTWYIFTWVDVHFFET